MNQETKNVSILGPMATFCSTSKLSNFLVRAKSYLIGRVVSSHKSKGKRCEVYLNVQEILRFISSVINETNKINH